MPLPETMRVRRRALGLTQADLARAAGVDVRQVRRYEAGQARPGASVAQAVTAALEVSLDELLGDPGSRQAGRPGRPRKGRAVQLRVPDDVVELAQAEAEHRGRAAGRRVAVAEVLADWLLRGAPTDPTNRT